MENNKVEEIVKDMGFRYEQELKGKGVPADRSGFESFVRQALREVEVETRREEAEHWANKKEKWQKEAREEERKRCQRIVERYFPEVGRAGLSEEMAVYKVWKEILEE